ncbi:Ax21 family protein, partial [Stenotrophomonas sp. 2YAF22]
GYNYGIAPNTDLVARVAYQKFDMKHGLDFNGYSTEVGVRTAFNPYLEGYALAGYEDYSKKHGINPDGEFYGRVGATAKFNQNWGLSGEVKLAKAGDREWFVGPRFSW